MAQQQRWVRQALEAGAVVTDSGLWLAGVDKPQALIASLRRAGLRIKTTRKRVVDAADEAHMDLAWRLQPLEGAGAPAQPAA
jgi:hypothetical protein